MVIPELKEFYGKYVNCGKSELEDTCKISIEKVKCVELMGRYGVSVEGTK